MAAKAVLDANDVAESVTMYVTESEEKRFGEYWRAKKIPYQVIGKIPNGTR